MNHIFIAGHEGMVGSALLRRLKQKADTNLVVAARNELDLLNQKQVCAFFSKNKFDQVYLAAAKVGGIHANNMYPAEFIYENLMIQSNVIHSAYLSGVKKLLFLGSSCIYPRLAEQPMKESALLTGALESTNEPYAIAKISGIKLCESYNRQYGVDYRSVMPTNLYGENDNFHLENSHVIPALIRRFHEAKINNLPIVTVWGSGKSKREFLYIDDMAAASIYIMNLDGSDYWREVKPMLSHVNLGTGMDCSIKDLVEMIIKVTGYSGEVKFDFEKPDGAPRKLLDVSRLKNFGWKAEIDLYEGLTRTYKWFLDNENQYRQ